MREGDSDAFEPVRGDRAMRNEGIDASASLCECSLTSGGRLCAAHRGKRCNVASQFEAELPPDLAHLRLLRRALADWLAEVEVEPGASAAVILATHEAAGNAMQHAAAPVIVLASRDPGGVTVVVRNAGPWKESDGSESRGRGLPLMHGLMSNVDVASGDGGSVVRMRMTL